MTNKKTEYLGYTLKEIQVAYYTPTFSWGDEDGYDTGYEPQMDEAIELWLNDYPECRKENN